MYANTVDAVKALRMKLRCCDVIVADRRELCAVRSAAARTEVLTELLRVRARTQVALETLREVEASRYQAEMLQ